MIIIKWTPACSALLLPVLFSAFVLVLVGLTLLCALVLVLVMERLVLVIIERLL